MSVESGPPAYAWDWVFRQHLVWREVRSMLAAAPDPVGSRYRLVSAKPDVLPLLRADYPVDPTVRSALRDAIARLVFVGHTDRPFAELGMRNAPRGLRWWWRELTGEDVGAPPPVHAGAPADRIPTQLEFEDVLRGYGD